MTDILKELFESSLYRDYTPSEELKALRRQEIDQWNQIKSVLGLETVDKLSDTQSAIAHEIELEWFREGFRLGASLMLELRKL